MRQTLTDEVVIVTNDIFSDWVYLYFFHPNQMQHEK